MDEYRKYEPIFGSWYLKKLIGKGSFGKVFEITREEYGNEYRAALKVISVPQDDDDVKARMTEGTEAESISEYYEGILREIINENEIMSRLKGNSNIVSYEDHQIIPHEDGIGYDVLIRMELLTPLLDRMIEKRLDEKEVVKLGIDICKALELCHRKNIIHRDIKPQNIFISDNGDFKLGDFGIARTMEKTTAGMSKKGTYKYMAPEVFRGESYDSSVDIYSLGIVLFSLLNGNRGPFLPAPPSKVTHNDEEEARMRRFRGEPIPAPRDAGVMLAYIIKKACEADPAKRYRTAEQMRRDLESYLENYDRQTEPAADFGSELTVMDDNMQQRLTGRYTMPPQGGQQYTGRYTMPPQGDQRYTGQYSMPPQGDPRYTGQYSVPPQMGAAAPPVRPAEPARKSSGGRGLKIAAVILGVLVLAGAVTLALMKFLKPKTVEADLSALMTEATFDGYNGQGRITAEPAVDDAKKAELLGSIKKEEKRAAVESLINSVAYEVSANGGLSNGDTVEVKASYDSSIAEQNGITVTGTETTLTVEGLKELPDYLAGATEYNGHFYKVVDGSGYFWTQAKAECEKQNGHLAVITDAGEQEFIKSLIEQNGKLYHYWLGANDASSEGDWRWLTGERVPMRGEGGYENWCGNQPNNSEATDPNGQDYMELQMTRGDQGPEEYCTWTDISDSGEAGERFYGSPDYNETKYYGYVCEWDMQ